MTPREVKITKDEKREHKELQVLSELIGVNDKIAWFRKKYNCDFEECENNITDTEEDFVKWDDYLEWKAFVTEKGTLEEQLEVIRNADSFTITE